MLLWRRRRCKAGRAKMKRTAGLLLEADLRRCTKLRGVCADEGAAGWRGKEEATSREGEPAEGAAMFGCREDGLAAGLRGLREGRSERFGFQRKGKAAVFEENKKGVAAVSGKIKRQIGVAAFFFFEVQVAGEEKK